MIYVYLMEIFLFFPKLIKPNPDQIPKSVLAGISPKFISVNFFGRIDSPGTVRLPLDTTLSDAIDITGPLKPLSGKVVLIRYQEDGTFWGRVFLSQREQKEDPKKSLSKKWWFDKCKK